MSIPSGNVNKQTSESPTQVFASKDKIEFNGDKKVRVVLLSESKIPLLEKTAERIVNEIAQKFTLSEEDSQAGQVQFRVIEKEGQLEISYNNQHYTFQQIKDAEAAGSVAKVKEVSFKHLDKTKAEKKGFSRLLSSFLNFVSSPITGLHRAVSTEQKAMTKEVKDASIALGRCDQKSFCLQMEFVDKSLGSKNEMFEGAVDNGKSALKAAETIPKKNGPDPIAQLVNRWSAKIDNGETVIIPFAAKNPHILKIRKDGNDIIVEDFCLAGQDSKKISSKVTYRLNDANEKSSFLHNLISSLKPQPKPKLSWFTKLLIPKEKLQEIKQALDENRWPEDPVNQELGKHAAKVDQPLPANDQVSSSDDPLKLIYQLVVELQTDKPPSKMEFYRGYVSHLIELYNAKSERLDTKEKMHLLRGLSEITDHQLLNALSKELGPIAADQVITPLKTWLKGQMEGMKALSVKENTTVEQLNSPAGAVVIGLNVPLQSVDGENQKAEASQALLDPQLMRRLDSLRGPQVDKTQALKTLNELDREVEALLDQGRLVEARLLGIGILRAIPSCNDPLWGRLDFDERKQWVNVLGGLAYHFSESVALSGSSLQPFEAFEIQMNIPLTMRSLIDKQCKELEIIREHDFQSKLAALDPNVKYTFDDEKLNKYLFGYLNENGNKRPPECQAIFELAQNGGLDAMKAERQFRDEYKGPKLRQLVEQLDRGSQGSLILELWNSLKTTEEREVIIGSSPEHAGYAILADSGAGGFGLNAVQLFLHDSSLMLGQEPGVQNRYDAAKQVYDRLLLQKTDKENINPFSSGVAKFEAFVRGQNPSITQEELWALQAKALGVKNPKETSATKLVPEEWRALMACEQLGWVIAAPGNLLAGSEGIVPESRQQVFVQKMARMKRVELEGKPFDKDSHLISLALVDPGSSQRIAIESVDYQLNNKGEATAAEAAKGRQRYLGALPPRFQKARISDDDGVKGMSEPQALQEAKKNGGNWDPKHVFKLLEAGGIDGVSAGEQQFSHHSVVHCFDLIFQYPYILEDPAVQNRLLQILSDRNVLAKAIKANPEFFIKAAPIIAGMITDKLGKKEYSSALFLMDLSQRIHLHSSVGVPFGIANGLQKVNELFDAARDPSIKSLLAGYIIHFYSGREPQTLDSQEWKQLLIAKSIVDRSSEGINPAVLALAKQKIQEKHMPYLTEHLGNVPNVLTGRDNGEWTNSGPYAYRLNSDHSVVINLQTGQGFAPAPAPESEVRLPFEVIRNPLMRRLFPEFSDSSAPTIQAVKRTSGAETTYEFEWKKASFKVVQTLGEETIKIIQVKNGEAFAYSEAAITNPAQHQTAQRANDKGVWINIRDQRDVRLAAKGNIIDDDAFRVQIDKNAIKELSVGTGNDRKIVCADGELASYAKAIPCAPSAGMLFLRSPSSNTIDEIRFPQGLEIVKQDGVWKLKGNESFEWQVDATADLAARFGPEHAQWAMAFKQPATGEQILWIFPHQVSSTGKRGAALHFTPAHNASPILFTKQGPKESTTESGWLYMAHLAYSRGNYALAAEYLQKIEGMDAKPFELPRDQEQINSFKQVAALVVQSKPETAAQKALQLKMLVALAAKVKEKVPPSQREGFFPADFNSKITELKQAYDSFTPSQKQGLKNEGLSFNRADQKSYDKLKDASHFNERIGKLDALQRQPIVPKQIPDISFASNQLDVVVEWDARFFVAKPTQNLMAEVARNQRFFESTDSMTGLEKAKNEALREGIFQAAHEIAGPKGFLQIEGARCPELRSAINQRQEVLNNEIASLKNGIVNNARHYAEELGLSAPIASRTLDDEKLIALLINKYQDGEFDVLPKEAREELEQQITELLLALTEGQQLGKALTVISKLENSYKKDPAVEGQLSWILGSNEVLRHLMEGSDRNRHFQGAEKIIDAKARRYLVTEYRTTNITRPKAKEAIEAMLDSEKKFVKVRMGLGKSTFIFPHLARFCMDKGYMPVVMFTEQLLEQSRLHMDPKAFIFKFDRNFGIDPVEYARQKNTLNMSDDQIESAHLADLYESLASLKQEGRYPITTPERRAALRNKLIELCRLKNKALAGGNADGVQALQQKIELLKKIEGVFKNESVRELHDEDVNLDISRDYDYALEDAVKMDSVNVDSAQLIFKKIFGSDDPQVAGLKEKILHNQLSTMTEAEFETVSAALAKAVLSEFPSFQGINQDALVDYLLGKGKQPENLPAFSATDEFKRLGALRTYFSETLPSLYKAQDNLNRGLSESNGCVVVPYLDGKERAGNRFGNTKEALIHTYLYYSVNGCSKGFFDRQLRELVSDPKWSDQKEWQDFSKGLESLRLQHNLKTPYEAFMLPEAANLRLQFLQHLIKSTPHFDMNREKITCNAQDIVLGNEVNVASGTGDAFALNLTDGPTAQSAIIEGETYLRMNLGAKAISFEDPMAFIVKTAADPDCHAIMIQGYSIGNDTPALIAELRKAAPDRQFVYPDSTQDNRMMMWLPGAAAPVPFDRSKIDLNLSCNIYGANGTRGTDAPILQGENVYVVNMVGPGSKEEPVNQSAWRARQLGTGQAMRVAYHKDMEPRLRQNNHLKPGEAILAGHVINDVKVESLKDVGNARVKALIFEAKAPLKDLAERALGTPLALEDQGWEEAEVPLAVKAENVLYEACESLFIKKDSEDWESQYGVKAEQDPVQFYKSIYAKELKQADAVRQDFLFKMAELFVDPSQKARLYQMRNLAEDQKFSKEWVEKQFEDQLAGLKSQPEQYAAALDRIYNELEVHNRLLNSLRSIASLQGELTIENVRPEISADSPLGPLLEGPKQASLIRALKLFQRVDQAAEQVQVNLARAVSVSRIMDPTFNEYLKQNLPDTIAADTESNKGSQVQVQQQQQQQQMQQQQMQVQQMVAVDEGQALKPPKALNLSDFISNKGNSFSSGGIGELSNKVPFHFVSARAKALLDANVQNPGLPLVYRLVVEDPNGSVRTCLITSSDYTESIGSELERLKEAGNSSHKIGVYPLTNGKPPVMPPYNSTTPPPDETSQAFIERAAWDKLLIGWTEFSPEERAALERIVPNLDETNPSEPLDKLKRNNMGLFKNDFNSAFYSQILAGPKPAILNRLEVIYNFEADPAKSVAENVQDFISNYPTGEITIGQFQKFMTAIVSLQKEDQLQCYKLLYEKVKKFGDVYLAAADNDPALIEYQRNLMTTNDPCKFRKLLKDQPALERSEVLQALLQIPSQKQVARHEFYNKLIPFLQNLANGEDPKKATVEVWDWLRQNG